MVAGQKSVSFEKLWWSSWFEPYWAAEADAALAMEYIKTQFVFCCKSCFGDKQVYTLWSRSSCVVWSSFSFGVWQEFPYKADNEGIKVSIFHVRLLVSKAVKIYWIFSMFCCFSVLKMLWKDFFLVLICDFFFFFIILFMQLWCKMGGVSSWKSELASSWFIFFS